MLFIFLSQSFLCVNAIVYVMVKVLFVDDSSTIMQEYLSNASIYGLDAVGAWDGAEALSVLERGGIDFVVSDMNMPRVNGIELLREMRKQYPLIPFVMATTSITDSMNDELTRLGAVGYFVKPVDFNQLVDRIREVLHIIANN